MPGIKQGGPKKRPGSIRRNYKPAVSRRLEPLPATRASPRPLRAVSGSGGLDFAAPRAAFCLSSLSEDGKGEAYEAPVGAKEALSHKAPGANRAEIRTGAWRVRSCSPCSMLSPIPDPGATRATAQRQLRPSPAHPRRQRLWQDRHAGQRARHDRRHRLVRGGCRDERRVPRLRRPAPPWDDTLVHHDHFRVHAVDVASLGLRKSITLAGRRDGMRSHVLTEARRVGRHAIRTRVAPGRRRTPSRWNGSRCG